MIVSMDVLGRCVIAELQRQLVLFDDSVSDIVVQNTS
jgi:hypothetical protein